MPLEKDEKAQNMNSCDEIAAEIYNERAAICEYSGLLTREQAEAQGLLESEAWRHATEVSTVLAMPFSERRPYLAMVEKQRGLVARQELAKSVNSEWLRRKAK